MNVRHALMAGLLLVYAAGCGKKSGEPVPREELDLLVSAMQTVRERYVDESDVPMDRLISNSILGMARAIDPHAAIVRNDELPASAPAEAPLIESYKISESGVRVIRIFGFEPALPAQMDEMEMALRNERPAAIVLDARASHGEDYAAAARLAEWFLPVDHAVGAIVEKQGFAPRVFTTTRGAWWTEAPLFVLVDRETSGPAEWLSAALQFHERGILIGETTRGFAGIQSIMPIGSKYSLRLSTGRALDPDGLLINDRPLNPDVVLTRPEDEKENVDWIYRMSLDHIKQSL